MPCTMNTTSTYVFSFAFALCYAACSSDGDDPPDGTAGGGNTASSRGGSTGKGGSSASKGGSSASKGGSSAGYAGNPAAKGGSGGSAGNDQPTAGGGSDSGGASAGGAQGGWPNVGGEPGAGGVGGASAESCIAEGTQIQVTNNAMLGYRFAFDGVPSGEDNPTLTLCRGYTYIFELAVTGHPFYIKTARTIGPGDTYNVGVLDNGAVVGDLTFGVNASAPDELYYQCGVHAAMGGTIQIVH